MYIYIYFKTSFKVLLKFNIINFEKLKMPKFTAPETEAVVKRLSKENYTHVEIQNQLKEDNIDISLRTIIRINKNVGIRRQALNAKQPVPKFQRTPAKRTKEKIQKVKRLATKENPMSYRGIKSQTSLSLGTIYNIIHVDLELDKRKKVKVHTLDASQKQNRKTNCRKLYEKHLAGNMSEYAVTLDEALVYIDDSNGKRQICYVKHGEKVPERWVFEKNESFKKGFMVVGIITGRGTVPLIRVPSEVKINALYYVEKVLKPLFTIHLPCLYPNEMDKVFFHHDKATSHTATFTARYLEQLKRELGIQYLEKQDIPVKAPDASPSPLDFFGFGYLKQQLSNRRAQTLDGVWKVAQEEWSKIDLEMIENVFNSWKRRLRLISEKNGEHIEQIKDIHKRKL
jgi:hypothetical protein